MEALIPFIPITFCVIVVGYFIYKESETEIKAYFRSRVKEVKKKITPRPPRERLKVMYKFETDKAVYIAYNTETIQGQDCVNIEIERQVAGKVDKIILEKEIFEDSWGAMGGDSFYSLAIDSQNHLRRYIKNIGEFIINESPLQ